MKQIILSISCLFLALGSFAQKRTHQFAVSAGYERFSSVHRPVSHGHFVQMDYKIYTHSRVFLVASVGYGLLDAEQKEMLTNFYDSSIKPVELPHIGGGENLYGTFGLGVDFLKLADGRHRFYTSLQGGLVSLTRIDSFFYYGSRDKEPRPYTHSRGPELSAIGMLTVGYDFYVIPSLSLGGVASYSAGNFGDIPNLGVKLGYNF